MNELYTETPGMFKNHSLRPIHILAEAFLTPSLTEVSVTYFSSGSGLEDATLIAFHIAG